jgi:hypothetical protein
MLAVRPDGRYAYAVNAETRDVTVVDGATGKSTAIVDGSFGFLEPLRGGRLLVRAWKSELRLLDMEQNKRAGTIPVPGLRGFFTPEDRSLVLAVGKQVVVIVDAETGQAVARLTEFVDPVDVVFQR